MVEIDDMDRQFRAFDGQRPPDERDDAPEGLVLQELLDEVPPDRAGRADDKGFLIGNVRHGCQWLCSFKGKH